MFNLIFTLLVVGALLVFVEIFVPGMVAGILGALAILAGIGLTYAQYGMDWGNAVFLGVFVAGTLLFAWWMRSFSHSRLGRQWTLQSAVPEDPRNAQYLNLDARPGTALTSLRPAGTALIDGRRVDVISQGELIEAGAPICVVRVEGPKVVVRRGEDRLQAEG